MTRMTSDERAVWAAVIARDTSDMFSAPLEVITAANQSKARLERERNIMRMARDRADATVERLRDVRRRVRK